MGKTEKPSATSRAKRIQKKGKVTFNYIKGNSHRVIYASGIHGGPTPSADKIVMSLFNERLPIPKEETYKIDEEGKLLPASLERIERGDIVREVEVTVILDLGTAKVMHDWIANQLEKVEGLTHGE